MIDLVQLGPTSVQSLLKQDLNVSQSEDAAIASRSPLIVEPVVCAVS